MTSQGRHRPQPHTDPIAFNPAEVDSPLGEAITRLEDKGYEIRAVRLHLEDHGQKTAVVFHLSPAPLVGKQPELVGYNAWNGKYAGQNVGTTRRRNLDTLLKYVEGLPSVRPEDGPVGSPRCGP